MPTILIPDCKPVHALSIVSSVGDKLHTVFHFPEYGIRALDSQCILGVALSLPDNVVYDPETGKPTSLVLRITVG
jgi:hypothetical protein